MFKKMLRVGRGGRIDMRRAAVCIDLQKKTIHDAKFETTIPISFGYMLDFKKKSRRSKEGDEYCRASEFGDLGEDGDSDEWR